MAQVSFRELTPEILATAPACPIPTMVRAIRNACVELAAFSGCMRYELEGQLALAGLPDTELDLPRDTNLVKVIALTAEGNDVKPYSIRMLNKDDPEWQDREADIPTYFLRTQNNLNALRLYPKPISTITLKGEVAIKPSRDAQGLEEIYLDRFQQSIVDGALARLLAAHNAPWFSPEGAAHHRGLFDRSMDDAKRVADADDLPKRRTISYGGV